MYILFIYVPGMSFCSAVSIKAPSNPAGQCHWKQPAPQCQSLQSEISKFKIILTSRIHFSVRKNKSVNSEFAIKLKIKRVFICG